jgi:hypothetical protein
MHITEVANEIQNKTKEKEKEKEKRSTSQAAFLLLGLAIFLSPLTPLVERSIKNNRTEGPSEDHTGSGLDPMAGGGDTQR